MHPPAQVARLDRASELQLELEQRLQGLGALPSALASGSRPIWPPPCRARGHAGQLGAGAGHLRGRSSPGARPTGSPRSGSPPCRPGGGRDRPAPGAPPSAACSGRVEHVGDLLAPGQMAAGEIPGDSMSKRPAWGCAPPDRRAGRPGRPAAGAGGRLAAHHLRSCTRSAVEARRGAPPALHQGFGLGELSVEFGFGAS